MPLRPIIRQNEFPYHVVSRSNGKVWFQLPLTQLWELVQKCFIYAQNQNPVHVHAFVLMNNHYHLVVSTPYSDLDDFMYFFNKSFSELLRASTGGINRMFGGPYKWTIIKGDVQLYNTHRYVFQNPVRAGLVHSILDYPYSTLYYEYRQQDCKIKLNPILDHQNQRLLDWYNSRYTSVETNCLRRGLKRRFLEFKPEGDSKILPHFNIPVL